MLRITPLLKQYLIDRKLAVVGQDDDYYRNQVGESIFQKTLTIEEVHDIVVNRQLPGTLKMSAPTINDLSAGSTDGAGTHIRVKRASERYCKDTSPVINKATGQPLVIFGAPAMMPSEATYARVGAWMKHYLASHAGTLRQWGMPAPVLNEHEKQLLEEVYHEGYFCGEMKGGKWIDRATLSEVKINAKSLLDDATSGGQALVPFEFDTAIVTLPYLHSQLLPYVDLRTAGSSEVRTAKLGQVTVSWGTAEGTAISLFDTDSLVSEVQVPINPVAASIDWGKDFEADTPVADFGRMLVDEFGQAMLKELDRVICLGNGTSEPEGFFNASGTVSLNSDNAAAGPPTLNDYIKHQFGVALQYRQLGLNASYVSNDTTYQRSRQIKIDAATPSTDQRPVMAPNMDFQSYITAGYPHRINNSIGNAKAAFICLKKYRLYRRAGVDFFLTDQGATLARANKKLLVVRGRYGGKLVDPNACAIIADHQS